VRRLGEFVGHGHEELPVREAGGGRGDQWDDRGAQHAEIGDHPKVGMIRASTGSISVRRILQKAKHPKREAENTKAERTEITILPSAMIS
jgi:hypothetical protein